MRHAAVGLKTRLQINHLLVSFNGLREFPLLHQGVTEERIIENKFPLSDEPSRNFLRLHKAVLCIINVAEEQERGRIVWRAGRNRLRRLFRKRVEAGIAAQSRLRDKRPTESLQKRISVCSSVHFLLQLSDLTIQRRVAVMRRERDAQRVRRLGRGSRHTLLL